MRTHARLYFIGVIVLALVGGCDVVDPPVAVTKQKLITGSAIDPTYVMVESEEVPSTTGSIEAEEFVASNQGLLGWDPAAGQGEYLFPDGWWPALDGSGVEVSINTVKGTCSWHWVTVNGTPTLRFVFQGLTYRGVKTRVSKKKPAAGFEMSAPNEPPDGAFGGDGNDLSLTLAQQVWFNASPSEAGDEPIASYDWSVSGGSSFAGSTGSVFFEPGEYSVTLTVTDEWGLNDAATGSISVAATSYVQTPPPGGGGAPEEECWDVFLVWENEWGVIVHEEYLFSFCCDSSGCHMQ